MEKQIKLIGVFLLMCFLLSGCQEQESSDNTKEIQWNNDTYIINQEETTVSYGDQTYTYAMTDKNHITITYPNGSTYTWIRSNDVASGTGSDTYDDESYIPGNELVEVILQGQSGTSNVFLKILFGLIVILGLVSIVFPQSFWKAGRFYKRQIKHPTTFSLILTRIVGLIFVALGTVLII